MPGLFRKIFFNESEITEKQYRNSRMFFIVEAMCSSPLATLVSGSYLAGLFCYLGASESVSSVIMSVVALAGLVQFVSPLVAERLHRRKLISTAFFSFFKLSLAFIMFTPMLFENKLVALADADVFGVACQPAAGAGAGEILRNKGCIYEHFLRCSVLHRRHDS